MKEYLRMSDVFGGDILSDSDGRIFGSNVAAGFHTKQTGNPTACAHYAAHAINSHDELVEDKIQLLSALKDLSKAYVKLLESGKDRIESLGGDCDDVCYMAAHDSDLVKACSVIGKYDKQ